MLTENILRHCSTLATLAVILFLLAPGFSFAQQANGGINGTVMDHTGAAIAGALVKLIGAGQTPEQNVVTDSEGHFFFSNVAVGLFHLTITAQGFAAQQFSSTLAGIENATLPPFVLEVAKLKTDVLVTGRQTELAEEEIKVQEKQRLLGFVPNYNVSYLHQAVPLSAKQKFEIAWKTTLDPVSFGITGVIAGVQQWQKDYNGYGQGGEGYAKRYGATYANFFTGTMIGGAILPSLFKQDPRYFVKGDGSAGSRALYAIANAVICKGDNGHWQPKYAEILGSLASSGISNLYYPAKNRQGAGLTFENTGIGIGFGAAGNLFQEFISRKITPRKKP